MTSMRRKGIPVSRLTDNWTKQLTLFAHIKVAQPADERAAKGQLGVFLSATLRPRRKLLRLASSSKEEKTVPRDKSPRENYATEAPRFQEKPLLGWTVCGHEWNFYLAWLTKEEHTVS